MISQPLLSDICDCPVRVPAVAGTFYPADGAALSDELRRCMNTATNVAESAVPPAPTFVAREPASMHPMPRIKALIVPHAGYIYSGTTAGRAYAELASIADSIRRVVLLGPTHRVAVRGIAVPSVLGFETPLGCVKVDRQSLDALNDLPQVVISDAAHAQEHSLEVQLPFLQTVLVGSNFSLVPLAVGTTSVAELVEVLDRLWGSDETLVVVSSDLSHYHSYTEAKRIDGVTADQILRFEPLTSCEQACGALPLNGLLEVAKRHGLSIKRIAQCNSGDTAGDKARVVGYAAFALYSVSPPANLAPTFSDEVGRSLLCLARDALAKHFARGGKGSSDAPPTDSSLPELTRPGASFVTLTLDGKLRGCIGTLEPRRQLGEDVCANAVAAAFHDPRFPPLSLAELPCVRIEISVLSAPVKLEFSSEAEVLQRMRPRVDGITLVAGSRRSTFLPQVWSQLPAPADFLAHLKMKAGLPATWWSDDAELYRYEVQKWAE